jgi:hypothetical protein
MRLTSSGAMTSVQTTAGHSGDNDPDVLYCTIIPGDNCIMIVLTMRWDIVAQASDSSGEWI